MAGMKKDPEDSEYFEIASGSITSLYQREIVPFNSPLTADEESYDPKSMSQVESVCFFD